MGHLVHIDKHTINLPADIKYWEELADYMSAEFQKNKIPADKVMKTLVAVEEIFVNIANYAYADHNGQVWIKNIIDNNMFLLTFIDEGKPYNPLEKQDPDVTLEIDDRDIGGLGIFMVKNMTDHVAYKHVNNQNQFTIGISIK